MKIIFLLSILFLTCLFGRIFLVDRFRTKLVRRATLVRNSCLTCLPQNDGELNYKEVYRIYMEILCLPYAKMVYYFWMPLKEKYWLTPAQIQFLKMDVE